MTIPKFDDNQDRKKYGDIRLAGLAKATGEDVGAAASGIGAGVGSVLDALPLDDWFGGGNGNPTQNPQLPATPPNITSPATDTPAGSFSLSTPVMVMLGLLVLAASIAGVVLAFRGR